MRKLPRILITAGPTREKLDSIRFISNLSTGFMGFELAKAALKKGYKVTLISGPTNLTPPRGVKFVHAEDARSMERAVKKNFKRSDCLFMASAVCDWRPHRRLRGKIKKGKKHLLLKLVENPDILERIGRHKDNKLLIGFALESAALVKNAKAKLHKKNLDLIVANRVDKKRAPFGPGKTNVTIIDRYGRWESIYKANKKEIAWELVNRVEGIWRKGH